MLLICQDGHAVSMASFLDMNIRDGEEWKPAKYVYSVATLPEYRGRGYAAKILKKAEEIFNMPLVLVPAEKELVGYYRKVGFGAFTGKTGCAGTFCSGIKQLFCGGDHCGRI